MGLYKKCTEITKSLLPIETNKANLPASANASGSTIPNFAKSDELAKEYASSNVYYISDIHLGHHILQKYKIPAFDLQIKSYIRKIVKSLFSNDFLSDIEKGKNLVVLFGGDISSSFELSKIFYTEFIERWNSLESLKKHMSKPKRYIFAILGNHELWDFADFEACRNAYSELFESLGIRLLDNGIAELDFYNFSEQRMSADVKPKRTVWDTIHNTLIVGGTGFAKYNQGFNANQGIYQTALNRQQELELAEEWERTYQRALVMAKDAGCNLVVLTHMPFSDWKEDKIPDVNCTYFSGHTHKNYALHDEEKRIHILADNQIGYIKTQITLKKVLLYNRSNPFAGFSDGYHEVTIPEYLAFYDYMNEVVSGCKQIDKQVKGNGARFFMIKHDGYYGFFLISETSSYVCAGGRIKKVGAGVGIEEFNELFMRMVSKYLKMISPYRKMQELISAEVKKIGGSGVIHGTIVDIDFEDHVMINPTDGSITYYYSPIFGYVQPYNNIMALLEDHNPVLASNFKRIAGDPSNALLLTQSASSLQSEMQKIDIKNSVYAFSNRLNQLQRLFDKGILRDWNKDLIVSDVAEKAPLLPDKYN